MSVVWKHFNKIEDNGKISHGECNICKKKLKYTTKGMAYHLKTHNIQLKLGQSTTNMISDEEQPHITSFFKNTKKDSLDSMVARFCAVDGLSFNCISNSKGIQDAINLKFNGQAPSSHNTVKKCVYSYFQEAKEYTKEQIKIEKQKHRVFSFGFDEWTSLRNRRYMNIIVYSPEKSWNLGLVRIRGHTNYNLSITDISNRLNQFDLQIVDFVALMSDGASINQAIAKEANLVQQKCLVHGLQLAIRDTLYENSNSTSDTESSSSDDDETDELGFLAFGDEVFNAAPKFKSGDIQDVISKVRRTVKYFRKSPVNNDELNEIVMAKFHKKLNLILDCKTRWNSLISMLERFYMLRNCIEFAISLNSKPKPGFTFTSIDYECIDSIIQTLSPIEKCIKLICTSTCSMYDAHIYIEVLLDQLEKQSSFLSIELSSKIIHRLQERFSSFYMSQIYLENVDMVFKPKYFKFDVILIKKFIMMMLTKFNQEQEIQEVENSSSFQTSLKPLTFFEMAEAKRKKLKSNYNLEDQLNCEFSFIDTKTGKIGPLLSKMLTITQTIKPSTCDSERAFSIAGQFCNKLRSRLDDQSLDRLCFLKSFFLSE